MSQPHSSIEESVIFLSLSLRLYFSTSSSSSIATTDVNMLPIFHPLVELYISDLPFIYCLCFCPSFFFWARTSTKLFSLSSLKHFHITFDSFRPLSMTFPFIILLFIYFALAPFTICMLFIYYVLCYFPLCFWNLSCPCSGYNLCVNYFLWHPLLSHFFSSPISFLPIKV